MSEHRSILRETADALFADAAGRDFAQGWARIEKAGFATLLIPEAKGGFGGDFGDLVAVLRLAGFHALPLPVGETIVAARLLADAGIAVPEGILSMAARAVGGIADGRFSGVLHRVPWGGDAAYVVAVIDGQIVLLPAATAVDHGESPAGEPRDTLHYDTVAISSAATDADPMALGALLRVAQVAGALDRSLALAIEHANQRQQFGKPLAKFQAVQQSLAILAAEAAAVNVAAAAAAAAFDCHREAGFEVAAAKLRANIAIGIGAAIAHQVHGAIGFTAEYPLHRVTRRMMGWRSEFGNDRYWAWRLGVRAVRGGGAGLWHEITARSDAA